jgi:hypothetical protein
MVTGNVGPIIFGNDRFCFLVEGWDAEGAHELHLKNYVYFAMAFSFGVEILNMKMLKSKASK